MALSLASLLAFAAALFSSESVVAYLPEDFPGGQVVWLRLWLGLLALLSVLPPIVYIRHRLHHRGRGTYLAWHDTATGLPNRDQFTDRLTAALALARREGRHVAVMMIEVVGLEAAILRHGKQTGQQLQRMVAERLRAVTRTEDLVARMDGPLFAIQQMGRPQPEGAIRLTERIVTALARPFVLDELSLEFKARIGVAFGPSPTADETNLCELSLGALQRAKLDTPDPIAFHEEGMDPALRDRLGVETELREAVSRGALALHFQPQVHLSDRGITGFEALLRWPHPKRGMIEPSAFIPVAEETGLIVRLGAWVLRHACLEAASWPVPVRVAVNLSPAQIRQGDIIELVQEALDMSGLDASRLEIEITESLLLEDAPATLALLTALRAKGVRIAIDDFGTGYSSLAHLWRFPFDKLKIDRSFISGLPGDERRQAIIETVLSLGSALHLTITAEGVENEAQASFLTSHGCDEAQGFLFSRPVSAETVKTMLETGRLDAGV